MARFVVIGVGNEYRKDDRFGIDVIRMLESRLPAGAKTLQLSGEGAALIEALENVEAAWVVDAVSSGGTPGTTYRLDLAEETVPSRFFHYSTHDFAVAEALEMARALGKLPGKTVVFGVEGADFESGEGLSPVVKPAVARVAEKILEEINVS